MAVLSSPNESKVRTAFIQDLVDRGHGYDISDSFVDDSELVSQGAVDLVLCVCVVYLCCMCPACLCCVIAVCLEVVWALGLAEVNVGGDEKVHLYIQCINGVACLVLRVHKTYQSFLSSLIFSVYIRIKCG